MSFLAQRPLSIMICASRLHNTSVTPSSSAFFTKTTTPSLTRTMATKKAGGSTSNGRDSAGRRLGIKIFPGHHAKAGAILIRQRGRKFHAGQGVGMGKDHTIFATQPGIVKYTRNPNNQKRNVVHVI